MSKPSDRYETPPEIFEYLNHIHGPFDLDVCAEVSTAKCSTFITLEANSLAAEWHQFGKRAWMNPPYSNIRPWVEKAINESKKGVVTCALLPADTSTRVFHDCIYGKPGVISYFYPKRIKFLLDGTRQQSAKFGSLVTLFYPNYRV